jgi:two-component system response regulator PilR (NtrC family)
MKHAKILIADDERAITDGLSAILTDEGYTVEVAVDGQKALDRLQGDAYGLVLADLKMPKLDGIALLKELSEREIPTECIIITGQATVDSAVQAMRQGAYDYIEKPLNTEKLNRLKALIPKALDKFNVKQTNRALTSQIEHLTHYGELTGQSEQMREVYQIIDAVATSTASVLILGPSTTRASAPRDRSSRSTARPSPRTSSRTSCSGTRRERSPAPPTRSPARSRWPTVAPSSSTKWPRWRRTSR